MNSISVTTLNGVGPKCAALLTQLNILTVQDLLLHLPLRYEDRSRVHTIAELKHGDHVLIEGSIINVQLMGARQYVRCTLQDKTHRKIDLIFFYLTQVHQKKLSDINGTIRCFGEVRQGFTGHLEMVHPEYALANQVTSTGSLAISSHLTPVYPTTKGLTQITLRKLMQQALHVLQHENLFPELLPAQFNLLSLNDALQWIHFPPHDVCLSELQKGQHPAHQRLIIEELIAHQLSQKMTRQHIKTRAAIALPSADVVQQSFLSSLSFTLTTAQQRVIAAIQKDMTQAAPMLRLVQGDVGSGKTVVACVAALQAIAAGYQVALMAPTEILAEQHVATFVRWLSQEANVALLTGRQSASEQRLIKSQLAAGEINMIIGTHALFQQDVQFKQLALLIIDEQHRFGVQQRLALMQKGLKFGFFPHQLIMSATPIPRTLSMTAYADLDISIIDELPPGRKPITTVLISAERRDEIIARVQAHVGLKKQAYWICTLVEESDVLQCQAAQTTAEALQAQLPELRIALVHGRLRADEKNTVMQAFYRGDIDLLVATTVVEVGVDVPNASLMIIENPERLGLAQLHQLRGRVGRGMDASFCVLLYQHPLSDLAKKRLGIMRESQDGFVIAEQDLLIRGPGDVLGVRQSGERQMRIADIMRDQALLSFVQNITEELIAQHANVLPQLMQRWLGSEIKYLQA